jgi:zinc protease
MMTRRSVRHLLIAAIAIAGTITSSAQSRPVEIPRIAVEKYTLGNGLEVILSPKRGLPMVAVNLWYHVGPANEAPGRTGFAHLFEHMMFQASKHVPEDQYIAMLQAAGASDVNGTTSFDRTNYYSTVPANQIELALWLESDRMGYLLDKLDAATLANQQDVVRNERRQSREGPPYGMAEEALYQTLFPKGHPYFGVIIGSHEDIQAAKLEDVRRFFREFYAPNNATLTIVGDFEAAPAKALIEKYFSTLRRGPAVAPLKVDTPKITAERRKVVPARVQLPKVYMSWLTPALYAPGDAEADFTAQILGGGRSSRLYKKLVYEKQIAQDVSALQSSLQLTSVFEIEATARPGHTAEELEKAIDEELAAMRARPPDASEMERARNTIETGIVGSLESIGGLADRLNAYNHHTGTPDYLQKDVARYRAVTGAAVQGFARDQLMPTARVVVHAVPGTPEPLAQVPAPPAPKPGEGQQAEGINPDEPWRAQPPKPAAAKTLQLPTPTTATLPNGLTLILNERRGLPIVAAQLVFKTGSDANPLDKPGLANFTAAMLDEGTATRNALQIADELARLGGSLTTNSSMDSTTVSVRSLSSTFPALLDVTADVVLRPSFPADEIERQRANRVAQLIQQRDNPTAVAATVTASVLYGPQHPYGFSEIGTEAAVKAMSRDDMLAFWKQNYVPNNAALVVAGEITMKELRAIAEKAFGPWQRGAAAKPQLGAPATTQAKVVIVDKPGPQTQLRVASIGAARSSPDFRPLQVTNLALGGLFSSRINMNLREKNGYSYGANSQFTFRRSPGPFQIASAVRLDATADATREIFTEVRGMHDRPVTNEELRGAKDALINSLPGAFETSAAAVGNFANTFIYDLGIDYYANYAEEVQAVTRDQALAVTKKYLVPDSLRVIAVGDRKVIEPTLQKLNLGTIEIRDAEGRPSK